MDCSACLRRVFNEKIKYPKEEGKEEGGGAERMEDRRGAAHVCNKGSLLCN